MSPDRNICVGASGRSYPKGEGARNGCLCPPEEINEPAHSVKS